MNAKTLLGTSLVANVLLLGTAGFRWNHTLAKPDASSPALVQSTNSTPATIENAVAAAPALASASAAATSSAGTNIYDWRRVESPDYRQYIANLRAGGCPEKTIRDIIIADVNDMFCQRARSLSGSTNRFEYWKPGHWMGESATEGVTQQQELSQEKRELLKALLGDSAPTGLETSTLADFYQQQLERMLDFLPADKLTPLMELGQKYSAKEMKAHKDAAQGDLTALRKVYADRNAELLQLLTPEQKFEYELRMSETAMLLRDQMGEFEPTEQQFREIFKARKAFDDEFGSAGTVYYGNLSKEEKARRAAAQQELTAQFQDVLGEDGYRLYRYEKRWPNDPLNPIAKNNNIPKETAFKVFDLQKAAQAEVAKVQGNPALSAEQRTAALTAMRAETEKTIGQVLGAQTAQAYVKKALWIKRLSQ